MIDVVSLQGHDVYYCPFCGGLGHIVYLSLVPDGALAEPYINHKGLLCKCIAEGLHKLETWNNSIERLLKKDSRNESTENS